MNNIEEQKEKLKRVQDVFKLIKEKEVKMIDFRFTDMPGQWQHFSIPADKLEESCFYEGLGFDGSSIRGWKSIDESDMLVMPDAPKAESSTGTATRRGRCAVMDSARHLPVTMPKCAALCCSTMSMKVESVTIQSRA